VTTTVSLVFTIASLVTTTVSLVPTTVYLVTSTAALVTTTVSLVITSVSLVVTTVSLVTLFLYFFIELLLTCFFLFALKNLVETLHCSLCISLLAGTFLIFWNSNYWWNNMVGCLLHCLYMLHYAQHFQCP